LSYAHEDRETVLWLKRKLERTWVPWKFGRRLAIDEDCLVAGQLTKQVKLALSDSRFLIVCCSEASATSEWVNLEIDFFCHAHGEGHGCEAVLMCQVGGRLLDPASTPMALRQVQRELADELISADVSEWNAKSQKSRRNAKRAAMRLLAPL